MACLMITFGFHPWHRNVACLSSLVAPIRGWGNVGLGANFEGHTTLGKRARLCLSHVARFSKVLKLFGLISYEMILFVSS